MGRSIPYWLVRLERNNRKDGGEDTGRARVNDLGRVHDAREGCCVGKGVRA